MFGGGGVFYYKLMTDCAPGVVGPGTEREYNLGSQGCSQEYCEC